MSWIQNLIASFFSKETTASMEAASRDWMMQCSTCGRETSLWEAGGIRYGAKGKPKRLIRCSECGLRWRRIYK